MPNQALETLFSELKKTPDGPFFNPWYQQDKKNDISSESPAIRKAQLRTYLEERLDHAKYLFIAEALGYQGGHFTGIAMTSERILLGHHQSVHGIPSDAVFTGRPPHRTSKPELNELGFSEPTATIMWKALIQMKFDPYECVLWNALSWHPYNPQKGMLSNRTPTLTEMEAGYPSLQAFLDLFPDRTIIAVGRKCENTLDDFGMGYTGVRHPANGGAPKFRRQLKELAT